MAGLCRLREDSDGKMEVVCLRLLRGLHQKFKVGAVSGGTLYLTSLMPPVSGDILSIDLTRYAEPEVSLASCTYWMPRACEMVLHHVTMVLATTCMRLLTQGCHGLAHRNLLMMRGHKQAQWHSFQTHSALRAHPAWKLSSDLAWLAHSHPHLLKSRCVRSRC